ncbi:MAG: hypothetical protein ACR2OR_15865 [Hyphomicrobiales bacterium]
MRAIHVQRKKHVVRATLVQRKKHVVRVTHARQRLRAVPAIRAIHAVQLRLLSYHLKNLLRS